MVVIIKLLASNEIMLSTCPHLPFDSYFGEPSGRKEAGRQAGTHRGARGGFSGLGLGCPMEQHVLGGWVCSVATLPSLLFLQL